MSRSATGQRFAPVARWFSLGVASSAVLLGSCASDSSTDASGQRSLEMVDPTEWLADVCEITDPVPLAMQKGFESLMAGGAVDEDTLRATEEWLEETADLADDIVGDLEEVGAPQTDRGLGLARAQIAAYQALAASLHDAATRLEPSDPATATEMGVLLERAGERFGDFGVQWSDVEPFNQDCPA